MQRRRRERLPHDAKVTQLRGTVRTRCHMRLGLPGMAGIELTVDERMHQYPGFLTGHPVSTVIATAPRVPAAVRCAATPVATWCAPAPAATSRSRSEHRPRPRSHDRRDHRCRATRLLRETAQAALQRARALSRN